MTTTSVAAPPAGSYRVDPDTSEIGFETTHMFGLGKVRGTFALLSATLTVDVEPLRSRAEAVVDAASFASGNGIRDKQVRSKKFLHVTQFPTIAFTSADLHEVDGHWLLDGVADRAR